MTDRETKRVDYKQSHPCLALHGPFSNVFGKSVGNNRKYCTPFFFFTENRFKHCGFTWL